MKTCHHQIRKRVVEVFGLGEQFSFGIARSRSLAEGKVSKFSLVEFGMLVLKNEEALGWRV
jgi:hypothetical protein